MHQDSGKERIIIPLDTDDVGKALGLVKTLSPHVGCFKVGLQLIHAVLASIICPVGPAEARRNLDVARELFNLLGRGMFWDGKFADIKNTVGGAVTEVNRIGVKWLNVHASAGMAAIREAVAKATDCGVLGVTVLTSLSDEGNECASIFGKEASAKVLDFADMLLAAGACGIICSPQEVSLLRAQSRFKNLRLVTPGVRPKWYEPSDQKPDDQGKDRVLTPFQAIMAGADDLVIGRPITRYPKEKGGPEEAARLVAVEIEEALIARAKVA